MKPAAIRHALFFERTNLANTIACPIGPSSGCIISLMVIPERLVSAMELHRNTGERGTRLWIAMGGLVYDVTDCPKWRTGLHEGLHFAGQDLTDEFAEAPHGEEVFRHECAILIGRLQPA